MITLYSEHDPLSLRCDDVDSLYSSDDAAKQLNNTSEDKREQKQKFHEDTFKSIKSDSYLFERSHDDEINIARSEALFNTRHKDAASIKRYRLNNYVSSMVRYMDKGQRAYWRQLFCQLLIAEIYEYNFYTSLDRKQVLTEKKRELDYYVKQIRFIDSFTDPKSTQPLKLWDSNDCLNILNTGDIPTFLAQWFDDTKSDFENAPNASTLLWLDEFNWYRLYWVWAGGAGGFLGSILDLEPFRSWPSHDRASKRLESPSPYCGIASWAGYVLRFCLHALLMSKHTVFNPWMSKEEQDVNWWTRFLAQFQQRKHRMLNDIAWGWVNYASMYWYTGSISPFLGAIGGVINVLLMVFDLTMAHIKLVEQQERYDRAKAAILEKMDFIKQQYTSEANQRLLVGLQDELNILEINWKYEQKELQFTRLSALLFTPAMALIFAFILPALFPTFVFSSILISQLVFAGCLMSVVLTAWETFNGAQLGMDKRSELLQGTLNKLARIQQAHFALAHKEGSLTKSQQDQLRLYHLEHKRLMAECELLKAEKSHIFDKMLHSVLIQCLFPGVVFFSLFFPTIPALLCIASAILIAWGTRVLLDSREPKPIDEFSHNTDTEAGITLTQEEQTNPKTDLFCLPGYSRDDICALAQSSKDENKEQETSQSLGKYGLFTTSYPFVPQESQVGIGFAM